MDLKGNISMEEGMAATRRKLPFAAIIIPVCIVLLVCVVGFFWQSFQPDRLTEEQIAALRTKYPVCGKGALVDMLPVTLGEVKERCETFVYAEAQGGIGRYENYTGTFFEYTLTVLEDSEEKYDKYQTVTIAANSVFRDHNPELTPGMRVVVPVSPWEGEEQDRLSYIVNGMFYVTDDGYTIPAFEELDEEAKALRGLKVEKLLEALKK